MRFHDEGIIIQKRPFAESKILMSLLTKEHGRVNGLARVSRKIPLDLGHLCQITWSAKSENNLGFVECVPLPGSHPMLLQHYLKILALQSLCSLLVVLLVDRHPYPVLYEKVEVFIKTLSLSTAKNTSWLLAYVQFEKSLLEELGFGLDITQCVQTHTQENLVYLSPRSGCAVSRDAGLPYHDKLFRLPMCFFGHHEETKDLLDALGILTHFLTKYFFDKATNVRYQIPPMRQTFLEVLKKEGMEKIQNVFAA